MEGFALLDDIVDVYVADLKFGNDACARQIAGVERYMPIVTRNLLRATQGTRLIVRHLLLPGHLACCYRPVIDWMRRHLPATPLRIMTGYLPRWQAVRHPGLASPLARGVGAQAVAIAREKGLNVIV
jgi:putative pyruvate formate lyase activating enzyme